MTTTNKYDNFKYALFLDVETTGIAFGCDDPTYNPNTDETYGVVSVGAVVVELSTWKEVDSGYWEVKTADDITVSEKATAVHGLTADYLAEHGVDEEEAVLGLANLIVDYFGDTTILLGGHNVNAFDVWFIRRLFRRAGLNKLRFAQRSLDSYPVGRVLFGTNNSDELFEIIGVVREEHNALEDARASLAVFQTVHNIRNMLQL